LVPVNILNHEVGLVIGGLYAPGTVGGDGFTVQEGFVAFQGIDSFFLASACGQCDQNQGEKGCSFHNTGYWGVRLWFVFGLFVGTHELDGYSFQKGAAVHDADLRAHFAQVDVLHQVLAAGLQSHSLRDHGGGFYFALEKTH
jgi:hypothetical protein